MRYNLNPLHPSGFIPYRDIEKEAKYHIEQLIEALEYEASQTDGIPEEFFEAYQNAKYFIGQKIIRVN